MKPLSITLVISMALLTNHAVSQNIAEINKIIFDAGTYSDPPPENQKVVSEEEHIHEIEGREWKCEEKTIQLVKRFDQFVTFNDVSDLYPGSIVQGKFALEGKIISIGAFKRQPLTLTLTGMDMGSGNNSVIVSNPAKATITESINDLVRKYDGQGSNKFVFRTTEAYSKQQALMELGLNVKWLLGSIGGGLEIEDSQENHTIFMYFKQAYYSISAEAPLSPGSYFSAETDPEDLKYRVSSENPAAYVSSVTYGRVLVAKMTSTRSVEEMRSALEAKFAGGVISANLGTEESQILQQSTFEVFSAGGKTDFVPRNIDEVVEFIQKGSSLDHVTEAVPIAYELRYLVDNSPFIVGDETTYKIKECNPIIKKTRYAIMVYGYNVIDDCENALMSPGEFSVSMAIAGKVVMKDIKNTAYEGDGVELNQEFFIDVINEPNSCIDIEVYVVEEDEIGESEDLHFNTQHCFPFDDANLYNMTTDDGLKVYRYKKMESSECGVEFFYRIYKV